MIIEGPDGKDRNTHRGLDGETRSYRVTWEIDVDASTVAEAAAKACRMMPSEHNDSTATVFVVKPEGKARPVVVDIARQLHPPCNVRQTACRRCGLDIEGIKPFKRGQWRDRGNNTHCPMDGRLHAPVKD